MAFLFSWTSLSMTPGSCAADQRATPVTTRNATTANHAEPPRKAPCAEWVWGERLMRSVPSFIHSFSRTARGGVECAPCLLLDDDEFHPPVLFSAGGGPIGLDGLIGSVPDGFQPLAGHAQADQVLLHGLGARLG